MIDLKKVYFGCSDANTEAERNPEVFKKVFFDPHNHLEELVNGYRFLLVGRKGNGKSAYSAKLKLCAEEYDSYVHQCSLNNFNNLTFSKIQTYSDLGGNPYISFWKCILLIECVNMINKNEPNVQDRNFVNILSALSHSGLLSKDSDISLMITKLVEMDTTLSVNNFFQHQRKHSHSETLQGSEQIYQSIRNSIETLFFHNKFKMIIDGLDDLLANSEFRPEIVTGLIRAVDEINQKFRTTTFSLKIIVLIRSDILDLCRDSNISKIVRDSAIHLSWEVSSNPFDSDLFCLVNRRITQVAATNIDVSEFWKEIFPDTINGKASIEYVLENIIYRPRDILQLFAEFQNVFSSGKKLSEEKIQDALASFSLRYFVDAMRDELTGFFPDKAVTILPDVLSKMGTRYFYLTEFESECNKHKEFENVSSRDILEKLFSAGYIGQHRPRERMDYTVFSFRNTREKFQEEHECILHRGLTRALTI